MRIVFDFSPVIKEKFTGFNSFGLNLLHAMQKLDDCPEFKLFYYNRYEENAQEEKTKLNDKFSLYPTKVKFRWFEKMWSISPYPLIKSFTGDYDIFHSFFHLMPPSKKKPRILTVHDLRRFKMPEMYAKSKTARFVKAIEDCDHILAVSNSTKRDLCEIFNLPESKITTTYLAPDVDVETMTDDRIRIANETIYNKSDKGAKYLVTVSASDKRKNIGKTVLAFLNADIPDDYRLVVLGYPSKNDDELEMALKSSKAKEKVIMLGPVEDINAFIAGSEGLIFASLYEGFGIPIINAMRVKVPVITSNSSSMPEAGGDAALYVDPLSVSDITSAINKLVNNKEFRDSMIKKGIEHSKLFTWENTAKQTLDVYKKLLS